MTSHSADISVSILNQNPESYTEFINMAAARIEPEVRSMESRNFRMRRTYFFCPVLKRLVLVFDSRFTRAAAIFMNSANRDIVP